MKVSVGTRLKEIMSARNLKQVDILNRSLPLQKKYSVSLQKSDLSQYVNNRTEPSNDKLFLLARTLEVSEAWLSGFDVPMFNDAIVTQSAPNWATVQDKFQLLEFLNGNIGFNIGPRELTEDEERKMREILATLFWDDLADFRARQSKNNK